MSSESGPNASFRVAVFAAPDDVQELGQVLERVREMHPTDALVHARIAPGIFPDELTREEAERLAAEISAIGVHAEAVAIAELPQFEHAPVAHHVRCLDAGLEIIELHGRDQAFIPWEDVDLVSMGQIPQEKARHFIESEMTTVRSGRRTGTTSMEVPLSPGPEAWICTRPFRIFRIDHKRMNYEYLGSRMTDSATANFRTFLDDLVARARKAYLTPATRAYLEHGSVADYSFDSAEDLQHATALHLLIHRRGK